MHSTGNKMIETTSNTLCRAPNFLLSAITFATTAFTRTSTSFNVNHRQKRKALAQTQGCHTLKKAHLDFGSLSVHETRGGKAGSLGVSLASP